MTQQEIKQLGFDTIGDGREPNLFFVTTSAWMLANGGEDSYKLIDGFDDEKLYTQLFDNYEEAKRYYNGVNLDEAFGIGTVTLEDRKSGVIAEKRLRKAVSVEYTHEEQDECEALGYETKNG